ncbi:MAG: hypothetical protein ACREFE_00525 [Limisphaerales bacterium]
MRRELTFIAAALVALIAGCGQNSNVSPKNVTEQNSLTNVSVSDSLNQGWQNIKEHIQPRVDYTFDKQREFVKNAAADLSALDQKIRELSEKTANATFAIGTNARANLDELRGQRAILYEKLNDVKEATADDWNTAKAGFQKVEDELKSSLKKSWPRLEAKAK